MKPVSRVLLSCAAGALLALGTANAEEPAAAPQAAPAAAPAPEAAAAPPTPEAPAEAAPADTGCGVEPAGARDLLRPGSLVLLGETPGTEEIPRFVGTLACIAASNGQPVTVGVEIPRDEQLRIERYLLSAGGEADQTKLLDGGFWRRPYQDGRSSKGIVHLLDQVRTLRKQHRQVSVLAYDIRGLRGNEREQAMAEYIATAREKAPQKVFIVLSGNVQVRTAAGVPWDSNYMPMGARLMKLDPQVRALDAQYSGGTAWTCRLGGKIECGAASLPAPQRARAGAGLPAARLRPGQELPKTYVKIEETVSPEGYHGIYYVGRLTASPPAVASQ